MGIMAWPGLFVGRRKVRPLGEIRFQRPEAALPAHGDMRGAYGFGHRAHRPDPHGHFGFSNDANYWAHHRNG